MFQDGYVAFEIDFVIERYERSRYPIIVIFFFATQPFLSHSIFFMNKKCFFPSSFSRRDRLPAERPQLRRALGRPEDQERVLLLGGRAADGGGGVAAGAGGGGHQQALRDRRRRAQVGAWSGGGLGVVIIGVPKLGLGF